MQLENKEAHYRNKKSEALGITKSVASWNSKSDAS
jgi:hypothetical protein